MPLTLTVVDQTLNLHHGKMIGQLTIDDTTSALLQSFCDRYHALRDSKTNELLLLLGSELFQWINVNPPAFEQWVNGIGSRQIEIFGDPVPTEIQALISNQPWELLAANGDFLTDDIRPFEVIRRIGQAPAQVPMPQYRDLTLAFMAADPDLAGGLDYEAEERAILLAADGPKNLNLVVEDSGNLDSLSRRLREMGHCDVVHLSCHGGFNENQEFVLQLEDQQFGLKSATVSDFEVLSQQISTLFLSA